MALWMSKVWLTEALAWKRGVNKQATMPNDIGSKPNLFSTLRKVTRVGEILAPWRLGESRNGDN